jgi:hypothetical protein
MHARTTSQSGVGGDCKVHWWWAKNWSGDVPTGPKICTKIHRSRPPGMLAPLAIRRWMRNACAHNVPIGCRRGLQGALVVGEKLVWRLSRCQFGLVSLLTWVSFDPFYVSWMWSIYPIGTFHDIYFCFYFYRDGWLVSEAALLVSSYCFYIYWDTYRFFFYVVSFLLSAMARPCSTQIPSLKADGKVHPNMIARFSSPGTMRTTVCIGLS